MNSRPHQCLIACPHGPNILELISLAWQLWRFLKDVFWMGSFVLIVLFWVELQTQVARMSGIEKLKPYLIGACACVRAPLARLHGPTSSHCCVE